MTIHIGKTIKELVKKQEIDVGLFAKKINCTRRNVYKIFNKPSIDTSLLAKISEVLGQNLFLNYITNAEIAAYGNTKIKEAQLLNALKELDAAFTVHEEERKRKVLLKTKRAELIKRKKSSKD